MTLNFDPDAFQAAKAKAKQEGKSLGKTVSKLILQALTESLSGKSSAAVFRSSGGVYGAKEVEASLGDA
jgi:hypothetical protein